MRVFILFCFCAGMVAAQTMAFPRMKMQARWWREPAMVEKLALSGDQQKRMDDVFQQYRIRLIDLTAAVDKEEAMLEPLMSADQPDESKIGAAIDRLALARAELEKANSHMLLSLRMVLSAEQWRKINQNGPGPKPARVKENK